MSFLEVLWYILIVFAFFAYLIILFQIIGDLFRDHNTGGFVKAIWIFFLIVAPFITALIYLIARGKGMAERNMQAAKDMQEAQNTYIRDVAGSAPADQIHKAKELLDSGAISQAEFDSIKAKALA